MNSEHRWITVLKKNYSLLRHPRIQKLSYAFIFLLSILFIIYAISTDWDGVKNQIQNFKYQYILFSVLLYPIGMIPTVVAWHYLLKAMGIRKSFYTNLRFYSLSSLSRRIPGLVFFVTSRTLLYQEENVPAKVILIATGIETMFLVLTGFVTALLLLFDEVVMHQFSILYILGVFAGGGLLLVGVWKPINGLLGQAFPIWRNNISKVPFLRRSDLFIALICLFGAWGGGGVILFVLAQGIVPISWDMLPVLVGIWGAGGTVSLTIGIGIQGMGIREATIGALLSTIMLPVVAVVLAIVFRMVLTVGEILWVAIFVWVTKPRNISN